MNKKSEILERSQLYCVLDAQVAGYDRLFDILDCCTDAGVDIFQIRDKGGSPHNIVEFCRRAIDRINGQQLFIVNDRVDLALMSGADGVHVGQKDMPIADVRRMAGAHLIVGASCQTLEQALLAQEQGADYIGFGSVFKTQTKPDRSPMDLQLLADVLKKISIPVFPIGGITVDNVDVLKKCGADRIAVTRALCLEEDVSGTIRRFKKIFKKGNGNR